MSLLALVAMLLLLVMPTAGQLLAATAAEADGVRMPTCAMAGMKPAMAMQGDAKPDDVSSVPQAPVGGGMGGGYCAYCILIGGMAPLPRLVFVPPTTSRHAVQPWRLFAASGFFHPGGLHLRGPPTAF